MALRPGRDARLRRAAGGRPGFVALACGLYLAAALAATWPAVRHAGSHYLAGGAEGHGGAAPGDHLQTSYRLWLVGHQLEGGRAPWRDPYQFRPEVSAQLNPAGWPFGLPYWPLARALGPVGAWNAFVLLGYLGAGGLACAWLRALGLARGPALVGGLAFALAPYRVAQSTGHLLGPLSLLLPLALLGLERARAAAGRARATWLALACAALVSVPASGQLHLTLGVLPFVCFYALVRTRGRAHLAAVAVAALVSVGIGYAIRSALISGSLEAGGRSLAEVELYSADWQDLISRASDGDSEQFVLLGWATPLIALAGLAVLVRARRDGLAILLGLAVLVPAALALGTNLPLYSRLYGAFEPLRYPRVPGRLLPIAALALAALVAFAAARLRPRLAPFVLAAVVLVDLRAGVSLYGASAADRGNAAYAAVAAGPPGRLLELPVFLPDRHFGSVYLAYAHQAPRERPGGYSTLAPVRADEVARRLRPLGCGDWGGGAESLLRELDVRYVAVHRGLYTENPLVNGRCRAPAVQALRRHGFRPLARDGAVEVFARA